MQKAFTLIELLIVVAIIAILAAIAVPNFLEAQTRAKVSRARADMRSVATAIEARAVDTPAGVGEVYPLMRLHTTVPPFTPRPVHDFLQTGGNRPFNNATMPLDLTTPVAYLTSLFNDPFLRANSNRYTAGNPPTSPVRIVVPGDQTTFHYHYENIHQLTRLPGFQFDNRDLAAYGQWKLVSIGPDNQFVGSIGRRIYDPTNGTTSFGDIIRTQKSSEGHSDESTLGSN
ncbi:prepilin-type N-terminal cleavage/methylation domain-containing protein [Candidatus Sumerlaeota bacterium]|nr:prepilin-type N-terminal cleavage/methylation domain-containing protein [Candidatus Sumerlaeota bacterium]